MTEFSIRIFLTDYYLTKPVPHIDDVYNDFTHKEIFQVPIIRIYGTTSKGQKCCAHIHGVFPYFYVPYTDDLSLITNKDGLNSFLIQFTYCLNESLRLSLDYKSSNCSFVYRIVLVKGKPFYGYQDDFQYFLKIYLYNPSMVKKAGDLLLSGSVMNKVMQPYETHIPYNLKFFIDYNLYGMNFLFTDGAKFRLDRNYHAYPDYCDTSIDMFANLSQKVWNMEDIVYSNNLMDRITCPKISSCELEVDISACDILNNLEVEGNIGQNPGLKNLWEEEKQRRLAMGLDISELVGEAFEERPFAQKTKSEKNMMTIWDGIVDSVMPTEHNDVLNSSDLEREIDEFIGSSQPEDSLFEKDLQQDDSMNVDFISEMVQADESTFEGDLPLNDSVNHELILQTIKTGDSFVGEALKNTQDDDWDDDRIIQEFIDQCLKQEEEDSIIQAYPPCDNSSNSEITRSKMAINNIPLSLSQVPETKHEVVTNESIEISDSDSDTDQLFNKTFIDLSLDDSSDDESSIKITNVSKVQKEKRQVNSSCEDLFDDVVLSSDSSCDSTDISILETYDGADDDECPRKTKYTKIESKLNPNLIRSPIVTRSKNKPRFDTENILIPLITKKIEMDKKNRKKKCRVSLKLRTTPRGMESVENISDNGKSTISIVDPPQTSSMLSEASKSNTETCYDSSHTNIQNLTSLNMLSPTTSANPLFSTPARLKIKPLTQQFMNISPIVNSPEPPRRYQSNKQISFSIPEASQESPHSSPFKFPPTTQSETQEKSEKFKLLESMKQSIFNSFHNVSDNTSMMSNKITESCHLTLLSAELFTSSQSDMKPNPRLNQILMFFYSVHDVIDMANDDNLINPKLHHGIIYIDDGTEIMRKAGITPNFNQNFVPVSNESDLMDKIIELVWEFDPDILVGFETTRSSWGYLLERAYNIKHKLLFSLGRLLENNSMNNPGFMTNLENEFTISELHCDGRLILNLWILLKYELALNSYTLERCVQEVLKERTPYYTNQQLLTWYRSNRERNLVVKYYHYRVMANIRLLDKLNLISRTSEFAKIYGIEFYHVFSRGSQYRVESMMLRLAKPQNLIAISPSVKQRACQKAPECIPLTLEPLSGLYKDPVVVLDFQSLYPSIMIAYNYCYASTLGKLDHITGVMDRQESYEMGCANMTLSTKTIRKFQSNVSIAPNGVVFARPEFQKGIISKMVDEILNTRIMIKKSMKIHAHNKALCKLLDSRQLGLKLIANVTYGYTAASYSGRMPCVEVGESIVRKSRETLEETIRLVNSGGPNGIAKSDSEGGWSGCKVIYGDTDSVFILMPKRTKNEAFILGARIADVVSSVNPFPVKLKFEKVYLPVLLEAKKKYVGYSYESPDQVVPKFDAKGIETVRRDNCEIASKILERTLHRLFSSENTDSIKKYITQQLDKIMRGDINIIDFIIAKEYRGRKGYKPGASIPSLQIARQLASKDPRAEPLSGERVPYIIIQGAPGDTLISCVRRPEDILFNTKHFKAYGTNIRMLNEQGCKLSYTYYITKQILPPLNRALGLVGLDVFKWYSQMPKRSTNTGYRRRSPNTLLNRTISSYFQSQSCMLCRSIIKTHTNAPSDSLGSALCSDCIQKGKQHIYFTATMQLKDIENCQRSILEQCYSCSKTVPTFQGIGPLCVSKDCEIFFYRIRAFQRPTSDLEELLNSKIFKL